MNSTEDAIWRCPKENPDFKKKIIEEFNIHPITAQIFISRGFSQLETIHNFLYAKLPDLHDPSLLIDMDKAVHRILTALKTNEKILIYGDNDVDGITGTALLTEFLTSLNGNVLFYITNRTSLNQSLMLDAVNYASVHKCTLLITVDCGISCATEIKEAFQRKIDVIITDHHEPTAPLPHCIASLNPKLLNSTYPNREITGVGVAFKLAHAIMNQIADRDPHQIDLKDYLDLVALGTVADMGALVGENRILVRYGLQQMQKTKRIGIEKLAVLSKIHLSKITTLDIAVKIAPRLNSLGRIANPIKGVQILLCKDPSKAELLAKELESYNRQRQEIERKNFENITTILAKNPELLETKGLVLFSHDWHPGVIPIIAAKIAKTYNRPTVIIAIDNGLGKGSLRTIKEFPLLEILKENADLFLNFGGHDFAAGLIIQEKNIETFKQKFIEATNKKLLPSDIQPQFNLDAKISLSALTFDLMESLNLLKPFGNENPPPLFYAEARQVCPPKILNHAHLKLYFDQNERTLEGIAFGMVHRRASLAKKNTHLQIAFTPQITSFPNKPSINLQIKDFKVL
jgi:single-stranded-DNA-specific exonuclease